MNITFYQIGALDRDNPFPLPLNYGEDFSAELDDGLYRIVNSHVVEMEITTFGVRHYYLSAKLLLWFKKVGEDRFRYGLFRDKDGNRVTLPDNIVIDVCRDVTEEDIRKDPYRWEGYDVGDPTNAFDSLEDIDAAIEVVKTWFPGYEFKIKRCL